MARRLSRLDIWINGMLVGHWQVERGQHKLSYDALWARSPQGRPLSLSLPFTPGVQVLTGDKVKHFFDNLLPDNIQTRQKLATSFNASSTSTFDLLAKLGADCAGAIQLLPPDQAPQHIDHIEYQPLSEKQIAQLLRNTSATAAFAQDHHSSDLPIALAGSQDKTALLWHQDLWCKPINSTPSTHIFKLPLRTMADNSQSLENQWLCAKVIAAFGLPIATCELGYFEDQKTLIVERFDRRAATDNQWIVRLPQEDMCQALGISPLAKYQKDGGPGINDCIKILNGSTQSKHDKALFFTSQVIFWLLNAPDGHGKNFSIQHTSTSNYNLAPLYDVLSIHPITEAKNSQIPIHKAQMAMAMGNSKEHYLIQRIQRHHFVNQALICGISHDDANQLINHIIDNTDEVVAQVYKLLPKDFDQDLAYSILHGVLKQSQRLASMPI